MSLEHAEAILSCPEFFLTWAWAEVWYEALATVLSERGPA